MIQEHGSGILGEISLKVFLSVLNFLLLKKCKGFTNYDETHNLERKLNLRHTTLENKLLNRAFDWHPLDKLKREEFLYIRTIFKFQAECVLIYMLLFLPNFSLGVLNPHVLVCGFLL